MKHINSIIISFDFLNILDPYWGPESCISIMKHRHLNIISIGDFLSSYTQQVS